MKIISLKKKPVANVNNRFLKEVPQNHCLGLLVLDYQEIWGKPGWKHDHIYSN